MVSLNTQFESGRVILNKLWVTAPETSISFHVTKWNTQANNKGQNAGKGKGKLKVTKTLITLSRNLKQQSFCIKPHSLSGHVQRLQLPSLNTRRAFTESHYFCVVMVFLFSGHCIRKGKYSYVV